MSVLSSVYWATIDWLYADGWTDWRLSSGARSGCSRIASYQEADGRTEIYDLGGAEECEIFR